MTGRERCEVCCAAALRKQPQRVASAIGDATPCATRDLRCPDLHVVCVRAVRGDGQVSTRHVAQMVVGRSCTAVLRILWERIGPLGHQITQAQGAGIS